MSRTTSLLLWAVLGLSLLGNAVALGTYLRFENLRSALQGDSGELADLPDDLRRDIRREIVANRGELRAALTRLSEARGVLRRLASADSIDPVELDAALLEVREATAALQNRTQEVLRRLLLARAGN